MQVGNGWSGKYSRWSYDESKGYVLLAKEKLGPSDQSVPLLDDELNCQAEAQLMLLRRAIKRVFGNGTDGDGFKIIESPTNTTNNFAIKGGDGTIEGAGYMFVEGWMPFLLSDIEYNAQSWAVALTTPTVDRTDQVYLDCWLEEIAGTDDSNIIDSSVGFETSRRLKLAWKVTVDEGATLVSYDSYTDASNNLHHIAHIATINRLASNATITEEEMISDKRNADRALKRGEMFFFQSTAVNVWNVVHNLNSNHLIVNCQSAFKFDPLSASKNDPQKGKKKISFRPLSTFAWQPSELNHFSPARMGQSAARRSRRKMVERVGTNMVTSCF